jgi:hypothetical protein
VQQDRVGRDAGDQLAGRAPGDGGDRGPQEAPHHRLAGPEPHALPQRAQQRQVETATERARLDDGPAAKALERLCQEYFELGDGLTLMFDTPQLTNWSDWDEETPADRHFLHTVRRGHTEGSIDAELHEEWVRNLVWALLYTAWEHTRTTGTPKHSALTLCLHTLRKAIAP